MKPYSFALLALATGFVLGLLIQPRPLHVVVTDCQGRIVGEATK